VKSILRSSRTHVHDSALPDEEDEISKLDLAGTDDETFQSMVRDRLLGAMTNNGNKQKVVPADQVRDLIPQGWEYVAQLPNGEAVVKLPF
jgi:hypothetical protein